jgi:hypothetical protein
VFIRVHSWPQTSLRLGDSDFKLIYQPKGLKTNIPISLGAENLEPPGVLYGRMIFTHILDRSQEGRTADTDPRKSIFAKRSQKVVENKAADPGATGFVTQSGPTEPEPQHSTTSKRQTVVDHLSASSTAKCISPLQAAAATQTP